MKFYVANKMLVMKESLNNTINEILHSDIVTKTKSTIHDFVSGVKNLFRHQPNEPENSDTAVNNYLKSPDEIEAEFKKLSAVVKDEQHESELIVAERSNTTIVKITESKTEIQRFEETFPEYMEENY